MHWKFLKGSKYFYTIFNIFKYWDCLHIFVANSIAGLNRSMNLLKTLNRVVYDWLKDTKWLPYGHVLPFVSGSSKNLPEEKGQYSLAERGKAGGHEPPLFPLLCHILAFLSSGSHEPLPFPLPYHHIWLFRAKLLF